MPTRPRLGTSLRTLFFWFVFCLLLSPPPSTLRAQTSQTSPQPAVELDLPGYRAELERCANSLQQPAEIAELRRSLPRAWVVRTAEGRMEVSTDWLTAELRKAAVDPAGSQSTLNEIEQRLAAMRKAATELEGTSNGPSADCAREHLEKIMQRREFTGLQGPSQWDMWKARITRWLLEQIYKLLSRLHLGAATGNFLAWTIVAIAFLALGYWVVKSLSRVNKISQLAVETSLDSREARVWAKDALAAAERGDYREAMHCAYWAAIAHLEGLGVLKRDRARTPRESLRLLDFHPNEQKLLGDFTQQFELIWYGYRPASAEDWSGAREQLEKMGCLRPSTPATANS
jgi:Domain of unknown function (DUF4129)